jgi:hypothetical protein
MQTQTQTQTAAKEYSTVGTQIDAKKRLVDMEQVYAHEQLIELFKKRPELAKNKYHPFSLTNKKKNEILFIGKDGDLFHTNRPTVKSTAKTYIDWISTLKHILADIADKRGFQPPRASGSQPLTIDDLNTDHVPGIDKIKRLLLNNPNIVNKFYPIDGNGNPITKFVISYDAKIIKSNGKQLRNNRSDQLALKSIDWNKTFNYMVDILTRNQNIKKEPGDSNSSIASEFQAHLNEIETKKASKVALPEVDAKTGLGFSTRTKLIGRGLRGGGICNGALVKDYLYRPIGAKFINLKALNTGYLSLRHPGGCMIGRKFKLSDNVLAIVKNLAFESKFDVNRYNNLSLSDKNITYDILKICKLTNSFRDPIKEPIDESQSYKIEMDKLIGELLVGNNSTKIKDELRRLSLFMYQNQLIDDNKLNYILKQVL